MSKWDFLREEYKDDEETIEFINKLEEFEGVASEEEMEELKGKIQERIEELENKEEEK